jgi:hypothetical protein
LLAPHQQGTQLLFCFALAFIQLRLHPLPEHCQHLSIQFVRFGKQSTGSGELSHPGWVHHCYWQACQKQRLHHTTLVPACGFHHNEFRLQIFHLLH